MSESNIILKEPKGFAGLISNIMSPLNSNPEFKQAFRNTHRKILINATNLSYAALLTIENGSLKVESIRNTPESNLKKKATGWNGYVAMDTQVFLGLATKRLSLLKLVFKVLKSEVKLKGIFKLLSLLKLLKILTGQKIMTDKIKEVWLGPGKKDGIIRDFKPENDGLHIDMKKRGNFEWWYFDARLDNGYMAVGFFRAKHERTGKTGVEITIYKPNGEKIQRIFDYKHSDLKASKNNANVQIGKNYIKVDYSNEKFPEYEIFLDENDLGIHLYFKPNVPGWMPGEGFTEFGKLGQFGWAVAIPRADVTGKLKVDNEEIEVKGIGYHDHNWITFNLVRVVDFWHWGRIYSDNFTMIYAYIKCNKKMDNHPINILMIAKGEEIIHSTGEFEFTEENFNYNEKAGNKYPNSLTFKLSDQQNISLNVQEIIDADNLLFELSPILRFLAKNILRIKPGYFRLKSEYLIDFLHDNNTYKEKGDTLHEMVIVK